MYISLKGCGAFARKLRCAPEHQFCHSPQISCGGMNTRGIRIVMPVIIPERDYDRWLQPGDPQRPPIDLLRPFETPTR
jgi:hypothetical protein